MGNKKTRQPVPDDTAADLYYLSDRTCCICTEKGKNTQIHHIDEDPSNNNIENLAILCLECHNDTQIKGGFGRKLNSAQVIKHKTEWFARVKERRNRTDNIVSSNTTRNDKIIEDSKNDPNFIGNDNYPYLEANLIWTRGSISPIMPSDKNPLTERDGEMGMNLTDNSTSIYWHKVTRQFILEIHNTSSFPAVNVAIKRDEANTFYTLEELPKINTLDKLGRFELKGEFNTFFEGTGDERVKAFDSSIPDEFKQISFEITYLDTKRKEHTIIVSFLENRIINKKI